MSARNKLEWTQRSAFDHINIYRYLGNNIVPDFDNLPTPIAQVVTDYYYDTDIDIGEHYTYLLGAVRDTQIEFSDAVSVHSDALVTNDPHWADVLMLLQADATSYPSVNYIDKSSFARALVSPRPQIVNTIAPYVDDGSFYLTGLNDATLGSNAGIAIGVSDFTAECFYYIPDPSSSMPFYSRWLDLNSLIIATTASYNTMSAGGEFGVAIPGNTWFHFCVMRKAGIVYIFINGVRVRSFGYTGDLNSAVRFGGGGVSNRTLNAYVNSARVTKVARYDEAGFIPPSEKFPTS